MSFLQHFVTAWKLARAGAKAERLDGQTRIPSADLDGYLKLPDADGVVQLPAGNFIIMQPILVPPNVRTLRGFVDPQTGEMKTRFIVSPAFQTMLCWHPLTIDHLKVRVCGGPERGLTEEEMRALLVGM